MVHEYLLLIVAVLLTIKHKLHSDIIKHKDTTKVGLGCILYSDIWPGTFVQFWIHHVRAAIINSLYPKPANFANLIFCHLDGCVFVQEISFQPLSDWSFIGMEDHSV
jgi:hypothetical protein